MSLPHGRWPAPERGFGGHRFPPRTANRPVRHLPAPQGWRPPAGGPGIGRGPRRGAGGLLLGCGIAAVIVILVPILVFTLLGASATVVEPTVSTTSPTATVAPEPGPTTPEPDPEPEPDPGPEEFRLPPRDFGELPPPHSSDPAWVRVQQSGFYAAGFPVAEGCPEPAYLEDMDTLVTHTTAQLGCVQAAWQPVLAALGYPDHEIPHHYYEGSTASSPCGTATAPAYYCSANGGAIYFGEDLLRGTAYDPIWAKDLVGHEYGHHLQALSGFFTASSQLPGGDEVLRRLEIQATCYSMGMLRRDRSHVLTQASFDRLEPHLRSFLDDGIHGSEDTLAYWGMRGFYAERAAECNTWVVGSEWVR